jgi:hypothetical protein
MVIIPTKLQKWFHGNIHPATITVAGRGEVSGAVIRHNPTRGDQCFMMITELVLIRAREVIISRQDQEFAVDGGMVHFDEIRFSRYSWCNTVNLRPRKERMGEGSSYTSKGGKTLSWKLGMERVRVRGNRVRT